MPAIPRNVRAQAEQAEQLQKELVDRDTDEPAPQDENADEASADEGTDATEGQSQQEPSQEGEEQPPKAPEPESAEAAESDDYQRLKQAHETLHGKYKAEVPRMAGEIRDLKQQLSDRDAQISDLQSRLQSASEAQQDRTTPDSENPDEYDRKLREELGDEFAEAVEHKARMIARGEVQQAKTETQEDDIERFKGQIRRSIDNFDEINRSQDFVNWLNANYDPRTGFTYQETLNQAGADRDVGGVVQVFNQFKQAQQPEAEVPQNNSPEAHQAPPRKGQPSGEAPQQSRQPEYTPEDYVQLQNEIRRGKWKGKEAEANQLEAEIHAALTQ